MTESTTMMDSETMTARWPKQILLREWDNRAHAFNHCTLCAATPYPTVALRPFCQRAARVV